MIRSLSFFSLFALVLAQLGAFAAKSEAAAPADDPVTVRMVAQRTTVHPGDQIAFAVVLDHAPGWHTYPAQDVLPAEIAAIVDSNRVSIKVVEALSWAKVDGIQWPEPHPGTVNNPVTGDGTIEIPLYADRAVAFIRVLIAESATPGEFEFHATVHYQTCNENMCQMPVDADISTKLTIVAADSAGGPPVEADLFRTFDVTGWGKSASAGTSTPKPIVFNVFGMTWTLNPSGPVGLGILLLVAALGGAALNFTPCVLPVIPIKILGLSQSASDPRRCLLLGVVMSLGIVVFWLAIGAAMVFFAGFKSISALFQFPWFGMAVGVFMLVMAIGMLGAYAVRLPNWVYMVNPKHESAPGSFAFGIMTAVLSTPCTAPFMGAAAAWAAFQRAPITLSTFGAIGVGMALPYLILAANPKWVSKMPRTGPASEMVKQVMGLLILAVAVFFMGPPIAGWMQTPPDPASRLYWWVVGFFGVLAGGWILVGVVQLAKRRFTRVVMGTVGTAIVAASVSVAVLLSSHGPIRWTYYTPERFNEASTGGSVVVMDFTAEWCLNCKTLENGVLHRAEVVQVLNGGNGVVPMKVDLTSDNPDGKALLKELQWVGIPLLAVFGPGLDEPIKYDWYTREMVLDAIKRASGPRGAQTTLSTGGNDRAATGDPTGVSGH